MNKVILSGFAALALTGAAFAAETGDSFPQDKFDLFNVQRGVVTQPAPAQGRQFIVQRGDKTHTVENAMAYAPAHADREAAQQ